MTFILFFIGFLTLILLGNLYQVFTLFQNRHKFRYLQHYVKIDEFTDAPMLSPIYLSAVIRTGQASLLTPISKKPCISYQLFEQVKDSKDSSTTWRQIDKSSIPFWVIDRRGKGLYFNEHQYLDSALSVTQTVQANINIQNSQNNKSLMSNLLSIASAFSPVQHKETFVAANLNINFFGAIEYSSGYGIVLAKRTEYPTIITNKTITQLQQKYFGLKSFIPIPIFILVLIYYVFIIYTNQTLLGF